MRGFRCDWPISLVQQLSLAIPYINETIVILRPFTAEEPRARWRATFNGIPAHAPNRASLRLSQSELAKRVGASRESVNKCFQEWRRAGIIRTDNRVSTIVDRAALEALIEPE